MVHRHTCKQNRHTHNMILLKHSKNFFLYFLWPEGVGRSHDSFMMILFLETARVSIGCTILHSSRNAQGFWSRLRQGLILSGFWNHHQIRVKQPKKCLYHSLPEHSVFDNGNKIGYNPMPIKKLSCGKASSYNGIPCVWQSATIEFYTRKHAWTSGTELGETCQYEIFSKRSRNTKNQTTHSLEISLEIHLSVKLLLKTQVMAKTKQTSRKTVTTEESGKIFLKMNNIYSSCIVFLYTLHTYYQYSFIAIKYLPRG